MEGSLGKRENKSQRYSDKSVFKKERKEIGASRKKIIKPKKDIGIGEVPFWLYFSIICNIIFVDNSNDVEKIQGN